ncbi:MAG TPA: hypothetical protein ENH82_00985 [bacterium]|nr:hypothetical protein [bacterium]
MGKTKFCNQCSKTKAIREFGLRKTSLSGHRDECKQCRNTYEKTLRENNNTYSKHQLQNATDWRKNHKEQKRMCDKSYRGTVIGYLRSVYGHIKARCTNPKVHNYYRYGGRGIKNLFKSSDELADYVVNELQVDPRGLQIDRIDNDGHYEKGNIRFVTCSENCKNRRKRT